MALKKNPLSFNDRTVKAEPERTLGKGARFVFSHSKRRDQWRFTLIARNGRNLAPPSQWFRDKRDAVRGAVAMGFNAMSAALRLSAGDGT